MTEQALRRGLELECKFVAFICRRSWWSRQIETDSEGARVVQKEVECLRCLLLRAVLPARSVCVRSTLVGVPVPVRRMFFCDWSRLRMRALYVLFGHRAFKPLMLQLRMPYKVANERLKSRQ